MNGTIAFATFVAVIVGIVFTLGFMIGRRSKERQLEKNFLSEFFDWCRRQDQLYLRQLVTERLTATIARSKEHDASQEEQMPRIQAQHIEELTAGTRLTINGRAYMRLADNDDRHITGWVTDLENGWIGPWSRLLFHNDMVTVEIDAQRQRTELQESLDELDGVIAAIRAHMNGAGGHWATIVHVEQAQTRLRRILNTFGTPEVTITETPKKDGPNV